MALEITLSLVEKPILTRLNPMQWKPGKSRAHINTITFRTTPINNIITASRLQTLENRLYKLKTKLAWKLLNSFSVKMWKTLYNVWFRVLLNKGGSDSRQWEAVFWHTFVFALSLVFSVREKGGRQRKEERETKGEKKEYRINYWQLYLNIS